MTAIECIERAMNTAKHHYTSKVFQGRVEGMIDMALRMGMIDQEQYDAYDDQLTELAASANTTK